MVWEGGVISVDKNTGVCIYHDWESNSVSYVGGYLNFKLSNELLKSRGDLRTPKTTLHHHQDRHTI